MVGHASSNVHGFFSTAAGPEQQVLGIRIGCGRSSQDGMLQASSLAAGMVSAPLYAHMAPLATLSLNLL